MTNLNLTQVREKRKSLISDSINDHQVFFAFNDDQFNSSIAKITLNDGDKIVSIGCGGYMPKSKLESYKNAIDNIEKTFEKDINDNNLRKALIIYELYNHECFYTGDIDDCLSALPDNYTYEEVLAVYREEYKNADL